MMQTAIIMGGGIQGMSCSLALQKAGYGVVLIEKESQLFSRTSVNQEGRLHLGFTYSKDETLKTGELVMKGSLNFAPLLELWLGPINWKAFIREKGLYLIHKDSPLLSEARITQYFERISSLYKDLVNDDVTLNYFGKRPPEILSFPDNVPREVSGDKIVRVIATEERRIDLESFKVFLVRRVMESKVRILKNTEVKCVERKGSGFNVSVGDGEGKTQMISGDFLVNCLWDNRRLIDQMLGIETNKEYMYRLKFGIIGKVRHNLSNNYSIISGAYGNVGPRSKSLTYISWHPSCVHGISHEISTPKQWEEFFHKPQSIELSSDWIKDSINNLSEFVPEIKTFKPTALLPGVICSEGDSDIYDEGSGVHKRYNVGVRQYDRYFSIDTGKFVLAPLFANQLVELLRF